MVKKLTDSLEPLADSNADLATESNTLLSNFQKLQGRYTALFKLSQLSIDSVNLSTFFEQVHQSISAVMNANNFYIILYDQTLSPWNWFIMLMKKMRWKSVFTRSATLKAQ